MCTFGQKPLIPKGLNRLNRQVYKHSKNVKNVKTTVVLQHIGTILDMQN